MSTSIITMNNLNPFEIINVENYSINCRAFNVENVLSSYCKCWSCLSFWFRVSFNLISFYSVFTPPPYEGEPIFVLIYKLKKRKFKWWLSLEWANPKIYFTRVRFLQLSVMTNLLMGSLCKPLQCCCCLGNFSLYKMGR